MNILLVSLLRRKLSPTTTASRPRVIYNLAEGLIKRGHGVSIIAPGNSDVPNATIIPIAPQSLSELPPFENQFYAENAYLVRMARLIQENAGKFDLVHNHAFPEYFNLLVEETLSIPMLTTLHVPYSKEVELVLEKFPNAQIVAQSEAYKNMVRQMKVPWVVPNGIDEKLFSYSEKSRDYMLWIGRLGFSKDGNGNFFDGKGVRDAIAVSRETGRKLVLMGNIESKEFFERDVKPFLSDTIRWLSPLHAEQSHSPTQIRDVMQGAKLLLFPTKFEESFGLVAAEAMACGTPVIGYARGSLADIILDNKTGFLVNPSEDSRRGKWTVKHSGIKGLSEAVNKIYSLPRASYHSMQKAARARVEQHFTIDKMVSGYEDIYRKVTQK